MTVRDLIEKSRTALQELISRVRSVRPKAWITIGACAAVACLCTAAVALHGEARPELHKRAVHARVVVDAPRVHAAAAAAEERHKPNIDKLVAMTHAKSCAERQKAAEGLAAVHNPKAIAALKRLANTSFTDESQSPGIFSCSSRRAAQRALGQQGT